VEAALAQIMWYHHHGELQVFLLVNPRKQGKIPLSLCTQIRTPMRIISAREFRGKQKDYLDLAEKERVIIHRGKNRKSVLLTPIDESTETDVFFSDPQVLNAIKEGIEDVKAGRVTSIRDLKNIWADIL
jgi:hypothetical protein